MYKILLVIYRARGEGTRILIIHIRAKETRQCIYTHGGAKWRRRENGRAIQSSRETHTYIYIRAGSARGGAETVVRFTLVRHTL